jgi:hypothetical protein
MNEQDYQNASSYFSIPFLYDICVIYNIIQNYNDKNVIITMGFLHVKNVKYLLSLIGYT